MIKIQSRSSPIVQTEIVDAVNAYAISIPRSNEVEFMCMLFDPIMNVCNPQKNKNEFEQSSQNWIEIRLKDESTSHSDEQ